MKNPNPTAREIEILLTYADLGTIADVAQHLGIAISTTKEHLTSIYHKLDVQSGIQAYKAIRIGEYT